MPGAGIAGRPAVHIDHPPEPLATGEWHVPGEPVGDQREQYVVQDGLARHQALAATAKVASSLRSYLAAGNRNNPPV